MPERSEILDVYRAWMSERWRDGPVTFEEVHGLKVFCEVHKLTVEEHEAVVDQLGVDSRKLVDDSNQPFSEWLRMRRRTLPRGSGALRFKPLDRPSPWKLKLHDPPASWQNVLAGIAAVTLIASLIVLILAG